ncbi:MAG: S-layer homology domain-containing protein [Acidimicrobiia bacterium]|nr:S-layer homology domain-containing protein [Acidimicrobiia bacterium]
MQPTKDDRSSRRLLTALLVLGLVVATPIAVSAAASFVDVPDTHTFSADIEWLADAGVTKGCNPPTNDRFCPDRNVTRGQMAAFMHRLADSQEVDAGTVGGHTAEELRPFVYTTRVVGPIEIPGISTFESVADLDLPAGKYLVQAKAFFWSNDPADWWADCELVTENVDDDVWVDVATEADNNQTAASFLAVDELTAPMTVSLDCRDGGGSVHAREIVIAATVLSGFDED